MIKAVLFVLIKFALRRACAAQGLRSAGPIITLKFKLEQSPVHPTALAPALASNLVPTGKGVCFAALSEGDHDDGPPSPQSGGHGLRVLLRQQWPLARPS